MAETVEERDERVSNELTKQYQEEAQSVSDAGLEAREEEQPVEGFQTWEDLREHAAQVPGIFGDIDTSGTAPEVDSVITANVEQGSSDVAEADSADGDSVDSEGVSPAEAQRQTDAEAPGGFFAEEVNEGDENTETDGEGNVVEDDDEDDEDDRLITP